MSFKKKIWIPVFIALAVQQNLYAQAPSVNWQVCMGGTGYDQVTSLTNADDGGYAAAVGSFHFRVTKLTWNGIIDWDRTYGGSATEVAYCIKTIPDKGYIVTGYTRSVDGDVTGN